MDQEPTVTVITKEYLEEKRRKEKEEEERKQWLERPSVWNESIKIDGQVIDLVNYNPDFELTDQHRRELTDVIVKLRRINLAVAERVKRITFENEQPSSVYQNEDFPYNGTVKRDFGAIVLWRRGQQLDIPHRTGVVSNFQGTVAHEAFHYGDEDYESGWRSKFGWKYCSDYPEEWEFVQGSDRSWKNQQTGEVHPNSQFTRRPELCLNDYARLQWQEDYADCGVVVLFASEVLKEISPEKMEMIQNPAIISDNE